MKTFAAVLTGLLLQVLFVPTDGFCYLVGDECPVCFRTDTGVDGAKPAASECPDGIKMKFTTPPVEPMEADTEYIVSFDIEVDLLEYPTTRKEAKDGTLVDLIHCNIHSCLQSSGACTPFIANSPGLSTHSPSQVANLTLVEETYTAGPKWASVVLDNVVKLDAGVYMIISHARYFVGAVKWDVAMGVPITVIPKKVKSQQSYTQYVVLPIGAVLALSVIGMVGWKQDLAMKALMGLMKDTFVLVGSLSLEILDIISDCIVFYTIYTRNDENLNGYLVWYAFFFGTGILVFSFHAVINVYYFFILLLQMDDSSYDGLKKEVLKRQEKWKDAKVRVNRVAAKPDRIASIGFDEKSGAELTQGQLRLRFVTEAHEAAICMAQINRLMGLVALLIFEDLPMMILNILIVNSDQSSHSKVALLVSMTIGTLMVAFKLSSIYALPSVQFKARIAQKNCMDLLEEIEK